MTVFTNVFQHPAKRSADPQNRSALGPLIFPNGCGIPFHLLGGQHPGGNKEEQLLVGVLDVSRLKEMPEKRDVSKQGNRGDGVRALGYSHPAEHYGPPIRNKHLSGRLLNIDAHGGLGDDGAWSSVLDGNLQEDVAVVRDLRGNGELQGSVLILHRNCVVDAGLNGNLRALLDHPLNVVLRDDARA